MAKRLSPLQVTVLRVLDGAIMPVPFDGTHAATIKSLAAMGMVKYQRRVKSSPTYYFPGGTVLVFHTLLTDKGSDFIYNGGLDKPRPVV